MPKLKTKKGVAKRVKKTARDKLKRSHAYARHLANAKERKRKRHLRKSSVVSKADDKRLKKVLPYR